MSFHKRETEKNRVSDDRPAGRFMLSVGMLMTPGQAGKPFILPHTASEILNLYCQGGGTNEFDEMRGLLVLKLQVSIKSLLDKKCFDTMKRQITKTCKISKNYFQLFLFLPERAIEDISIHRLIRQINVQFYLITYILSNLAQVV